VSYIVFAHFGIIRVFLSRFVHGGEVHACREPKWISVEHGVVWVEEVIVHAIEDMAAVIRRQRSWAGERRVL
jgi:hypothetical protein